MTEVVGGFDEYYQRLFDQGWDRSATWWLNAVVEEVDELQAEVEANDSGRIEKELGDVLINLLMAAKVLDVDPNRAAQLTMKRIENRMAFLKAHPELPTAEAWAQVKASES